MENLELDKSEAALLAELGEVFHTVHSAGWTRIKALIEGLTEEAHEDMVGCHESLETRGLLQMRWQQREAMKRAIENYVGDCLNRRQVMMQEIAARDEQRERMQLIDQIEKGA